MSKAPLNIIRQKDKELSKHADVRVSLPNMFKLRKVGNDFCSDPEQIVGIFTKNRIFGGQTFAQFYLVAKELGNGQPVKRLDIIFQIAGNAIQPILYRKRLISRESQFISMEALQDGRVIASGCARLTDVAPFDFMPKMPFEIPPPLSCLPIKEVYAQQFVDPWIAKWGSTLDTVQLGPNSELFEIRPINFVEYVGMDPSTHKTQAWLRLAPQLQDVEIDPMFVPLTICDYMACHPVLIALDQRHIRFMTAASLTHKVCIHRNSGFNPKGFFFVENVLESLSRDATALYQGQVFDENGQCILSFSQMNFNQLKLDDDKSKL